MARFCEWLLLRLLEHAEFFDAQAYNSVFEGELEKIADADARESLRGFDWGSYISRSLARAGFRNDEQQEAFHGIVIKLLVSPGKLFRGWQPGRHGPLDRRFRRSVWNAIRNIAAKTRNRRKLVALTDPSVMAGKVAGREPQSDLIDQFRQLVSQRLGSLAVAILDQRLRGEDTRELVGKLGSGYEVKREVRAIKELARWFAARLGDPAFAGMVSRAMEEEALTVARRRVAGRERQPSPQR